MNGAWAFRIGSRPHEGGGHVYRCVTLARALATAESVSMVLDQDAPPALRAHAAGAASVMALATASQRGWDGVVIDGYEFAAAEWVEWRIKARRLVALCDGDVAETPLPPGAADLIIAPWATTVRAGDCALVGIQYALVDPGFSTVPPRSMISSVERVLIGFGLRDSKNATGLTLQALQLLRSRGFRPHVDVALGMNAPNAAAVRDAVAGFGPDATIHVQTGGMGQLLAAADIVIGGGGISLLERLGAGKPSVTIPLVTNQEIPAARAAAGGATIATPRPEELSARDLAGVIEKLALDSERRAAMSVAARSLVDGRASIRIVSALNKLANEISEKV